MRDDVKIKKSPMEILCALKNIKFWKIHEKIWRHRKTQEKFKISAIFGQIFMSFTVFSRDCLSAEIRAFFYENF